MIKIPSNSITKKVGFIFLLAILLQIPLFFINGIINERNDTYENMVDTLGNEWGQKQTIHGIFLVINGTKEQKIKDEEGNTITQKVPYEKIIIPSQIDVKIDILDEVRQKGIYKASVYNANINIGGNFADLDEKLPQDFDEIYLSLGLLDAKSLVNISTFKLNSIDLKPNAGTNSKNSHLRYGISSLINKNMLKNNTPFEISFTLRGSKGIEILPLAQKNTLDINSKESKPSFYGTLPVSKNLDNNGFNAKYEIMPFTMNYQKAINNSNHYLNDNLIGINLYEGITHYRQVIRAAKYGILFIMLSLFVVYVFEILGKKPTHYIQYGVVGFSLTLFYLVLLSMSEYFSFELAYIIATLMVVIPNALYIKALTNSKKFGFGMLLFLGGVYAVLFSVLQMEQFALITGTILIMIVLYVLMYITKNIDNFLDKKAE
ncbi:cell envelope integrity protein CreD [Campylobacter sp. RM12651]|uniref:cell envelope integrity protein CreD n=1 Tax=Campylobacter sp. RM12651 TaxID=1660079 RepID=UPI001EFB6C99|nr:cell envelope integrity protein CreD [Campylobacter sp. RM12651]ULO03546.1 inner membrane protein, CreD family [Campylobacter sp. RM12651]